MSEGGPRRSVEHEPQRQVDRVPLATRDERTVRGIGQTATSATVQSPEVARRAKIERALGQTATRNRDRER
jgi:hypothetical protein